jgi:MYXO-CTERM domain-containing protein
MPDIAQPVKREPVPQNRAFTGALRMSERRLVLVVGLLAAAPVLISAVSAALAGWTPVFDDAIVALRAFDVLSSHSPLVGQYSDASLRGAQPVFNAGPLLFWLLAVPTRLPGDWALPLTMGLVNTASIVGVVWLAHRRGGRLFMFVTAVALIGMCRSLPDGTLYAVVNPWSALLPLTLLFFLAWSVACGEHALLPLTVLVASFGAQVHFSLILPTLVALTVAFVGVATSLSGARRSLIAALAVGLVCWSAPLVDQAFNSPGNLEHIVTTATADEQRFGQPGGWRAAAHAVGISPWWLGRPRAQPMSILEVLEPPSATAVVSSILAAAALGALALLGVRRRRRDLTAAAALALLLGGAIVLATSSNPLRLALVIGKALGWTVPAGLFIWLVLAWSMAVLVRPTPRAVRRPAVSAAAGLGITALAAALVALDHRPDPFQWSFQPARTTTSHLNARIPKSGTSLVIVRSSSSVLPAFVFGSAIPYQLRRLGRGVVVGPGALQSDVKLGSQYSVARHPAQRRVDVEHDNRPTARPGGRVLARVPLPDDRHDFSPRVLTVSVSPVRACPATSTPAPPQRRPRIVPGRVSGFVDHAQIVGTNVQFCGWAATARDRRVADGVLVVADGRIVGAVRPDISRPDVAQARGSLGDRFGYSVSVPLSTVRRGGRKATVRVLGVERGVASQLPIDCQTRRQDFGC